MRLSIGTQAQAARPGAGVVVGALLDEAGQDEGEGSRLAGAWPRGAGAAEVPEV